MVEQVRREISFLETLQYAFDAALVRRYHTEPVLRQETIGHHSHGVATVLLILHPNCSVNLLKAALVHDLEEKISGDMPAPAKRDLKLTSIFGDYGEKIRMDHGLPNVDLFPWEEIQLKFADYAQAAMNCLHEMKAGNQHLRPVLLNFIKYMNLLIDDLDKREREMLLWIELQASVAVEDGR